MQMAEKLFTAVCDGINMSVVINLTDKEFIMAVRYESPRHMGDQEVATELFDNQHPRENEGVSFEPTDVPTFDTTVERIIPKGTENSDEWGNTLSRYRVVMSDGTKLGMNVCEPAERVTDIPIFETPAWFTGLHGFNENSQRAFGSLGFPSVLLGHVGGERDGAVKEIARSIFKPWEVVREMREISLARQAHNMIEVYKHRWAGFRFNQDYMFTHGNSRGGMVQFPLLAMAHKRGIDVLFALPVAPCFHDPFTREAISELRQQPINETVNLGKILARNMFDMAGSGINTINPSPKSLVYEFAHMASLFSGDAGSYDDKIPADQHMLILAYESDIAGQKARWEESYADFPNVYVRGVPGAHLSIADRRTRSYVMRAFDRMGQQLKDGQDPEELDMTHVSRPLTIVD